VLLLVDPRRHRPLPLAVLNPGESALLARFPITPPTSAVCSSLRPFPAAAVQSEPAGGPTVASFRSPVGSTEADGAGSTTPPPTVGCQEWWLRRATWSARQQHRLSPHDNPYGIFSPEVRLRPCYKTRTARCGMSFHLFRRSLVPGWIVRAGLLRSERPLILPAPGDGVIDFTVAWPFAGRRDRRP